MRDERGFTILETLIAAAIVVVIAFVALAACQTVARVIPHAFVADSSAQAGDAQISMFQNDAATALGVYVPDTDMNGLHNAGAAGGHELDYYSKSDDGTALNWRYIYDPARQTLQRFDCDSTGACGVRTTTTGRIDVAAAYPPLRHVVNFSVTTVSADALADPAHNPYSGVADLFAQKVEAYNVPFDAPGARSVQPAGGNHVVQVTLETTGGTRRIHLLGGTMPSGFTVTGLPVWHAIVFRVDQTHRSSFGIVGKSHVFINARVDVSYDHWHKSRIAWCIFNLLGNPDGLDGHDPHADYKPDEPIESAASILAACQKQNPTPPPPGAPSNTPAPGTVTKSIPPPTPPPCWTNPGPGGRCWPPDAPPDWAPPTPLPIDTPPAAWCAAHAQSVACPAPTPSPSTTPTPTSPIPSSAPPTPPASPAFNLAPTSPAPSSPPAPPHS